MKFFVCYLLVLGFLLRIYSIITKPIPEDMTPDWKLITSFSNIFIGLGVSASYYYPPSFIWELYHETIAFAIGIPISFVGFMELTLTIAIEKEG